MPLKLAGIFQKDKKSQSQSVFGDRLKTIYQFTQSSSRKTQYMKVRVWFSPCFSKILLAGLLSGQEFLQKGTSAGSVSVVTSMTRNCVYNNV